MDQNKSKLSISHALSIGWQGMKKNFWSLLLFGIILLIIAAVLQLTRSLLGLSLGSNIGVFYWIWLAVALLVIKPLLTIAKKTTALSLTYGSGISWSAFKKTATIWWKVLLASIIYGILVVGGTMLLIVPGILLSIMFSLTIFILVDRPDVGIIDAFLESQRLTKGNRWKLFGFWFVQAGVMFLGLLALGVGVIVSIMIIFIAKAAIYVLLKKNIQGEDDVQEITSSDSREENTETVATDESSELSASVDSISLVETAPKGKSWVSWVLAVLGVITIILTIAIPIVLSILQDAKISAGNALAVSYIAQIPTITEEYYDENGSYVDLCEDDRVFDLSNSALDATSYLTGYPVKYACASSEDEWVVSLHSRIGTLVCADHTGYIGSDRYKNIVICE